MGYRGFRRARAALDSHGPVLSTFRAALQLARCANSLLTCRRPDAQLIEEFAIGLREADADPAQHPLPENRKEASSEFRKDAGSHHLIARLALLDMPRPVDLSLLPAQGSLQSAQHMPRNSGTQDRRGSRFFRTCRSDILEGRGCSYLGVSTRAKTRSKFGGME